jgi:hypothetical protein
VTIEPELMDEGFEDCACHNPCGMEPMGCAGCQEMGGSSSKEDYEDMDFDDDAPRYEDEEDEDEED